jgi:flagellar biosynthesis/type III secretory pathway protein FliH
VAWTDKLYGATATRGSNDHLAEQCKDELCPRLPCRMWKDGYGKGWDDGYEEGYRKGYAAGYSAGYAAGYSAGYSAGFSAGSASNGSG